ncbi:MAG TPA: hypothetical protein VKC66_04910 [Xanthobacteraceae bacterium]|nr:hypothetical protein [Xanthobacteraceae bacterium]
MTSAWKELPGRKDCADGQDVRPDENQLEMFEVAPHARAETLLSPDADSVYDGSHERNSGPRPVDMVVTEVSAHDFRDVGGTHADELRRLEDSIRWLMNEGSVRLPRAATLPPVRGLIPVELHEDGSLLLDPDILFQPRPPQQHRGSLGRGAAVLIVSAIAAPMAYFVATWTQSPGMATPPLSTTIPDAISAATTRVATLAPAATRPPPGAGQIHDDVSGNPQPEPTVINVKPLVETNPSVGAEAGTSHPTGGLEPGVLATPSDPAPGPGLAQSGSPPPLLATPPQPLGAAVAPPDPASGPGAPSVAELSSAPPAVAPPRGPSLSAREIATLLERGRVLFDAGDLAAARLFFRRAANAGDAGAALAMGATYDPDVLAKHFVHGIEANPEEARMWYERARELGSPEGPRRIESMLAHR